MEQDDFTFEVFVMLMAGIIGLFIMAVFVVSMVLIHRQRQVRNRHRMELMQAEYENTLLNTEKEIREETLRFVSQELHDNIGQMLSLTKLVLSNPDPSSVSEGRSLINDIIKEVRSLSKSINRDYIRDVDFIVFLQEELDKIQRSGFCKTLLTQPSVSVEGLEGDKKLILIRLVQECLNNAIKHASPGLIEIKIMVQGGVLQVEIADDGVGFDPQQKSTGLGLTNMRVRMEAVGGRLNIQSRPEGGTKVAMVLDLNPELVEVINYQ